jgi:hypothetical protein
VGYTVIRSPVHDRSEYSHVLQHLPEVFRNTFPVLVRDKFPLQSKDMAFSVYDFVISLVGMSPFIIPMVVSVVIWSNKIASRFTPEDTQQIVILISVAMALLFGILLFIGTTCMEIRPTEQFADMEKEDTPKKETEEDKEDRELLHGIAMADAEVCKLITRADHFIQGNVGHPGIENPSLVTDAQEKARGSGPIVECTTHASTKDDSITLEDAENHLTRLENTLQAFTGPTFQTAYNNTVICKEDFTGTEKPPVNRKQLQERLKKVNTTIAEQQKRLLDPIDAKTAALRRGEVSDCDKRRGAKTQLKQKPPAGSLPSKE